MKISPVYTMPFSFHSGSGFCLHDTVMRFRTELISDSTVYTISDWFHGTFRAFSFENAKTV